MKILSKILVFSFFLLSIFYFLSSATFVNAASQTHSTSSGQANNYPVPNTNADVPNNLHNWTQTVMIEVMSSLTCQIAGVDPINAKQGCLGIDSASGKIGFLPSAVSGQANGGGAIGFVGNMISVLYTPPLHTGDYFQNLAQNFGISKHAFAQKEDPEKKGGAGFQGLTPLIGIWSAFRNIVYLFLVIIFVVIGLAIMLRIKIDPRTVMTIQNQIPKIIIGILAVTFSFAIAGFLIDLMWVFIYLIYGVISPIGDIKDFNPTNLQGSNPFGLIGYGEFYNIPKNASVGIGDIISSLLGGRPDSVTGYTASALTGATIGALLGTIVPGIGNLVGGAIGAAVGGGIGVAVGAHAIGFVGGIIVFIIIIISLLIALFRLWFTLIMAYVHILIDVVLAPFWIIGGIVPGSPISLSGWLRDIIANLAAFPAVIGMFMLGKVFMDSFGKCPASNPNCSTSNFVPPLIGNPGEPSSIGSLIGLGIILMTPNIVNMLKAALKAPKVDTGGALKGLGAGVALPVSTGKNIGGIIAGRNEAYVTPTTGGGAYYEPKGIRRGLLGKFLR